MLASDGVNTAIWHTTNVAAAAPVWTKGASVPGVFTVIRATKTPGTVMVFRPFSIPASANVAIKVFGTPQGTGYAGPIAAGDVHTYNSLPNTTFCPRNDIGLVYDAAVDISMSYSPSDYAGSCTPNFTVHLDPGDVYDYSHPPLSTISNKTQIVWSSATDVISVTVRIDHVYGTGTGNSEVRISTDYGATFAAPVTVGSSPGAIGAFDVQRSGGVSYAAALNALKKSSSVGGSYSAFATFASGSPVAVCLPYHRFGAVALSSAQTSVSDPDVLCMLDASDGAGTLKRITGAGVVSDITPVSGAVGYTPNGITTAFGTHAAVLCSVSGDRRLYTCTNLSQSSAVTWTLRASSLSSNAMFVRSRRNDMSGKVAANGQLMYSDGDQWYSSHWGANGFFRRIQPVSGINGFDW